MARQSQQITSLIQIGMQSLQSEVANLSDSISAIEQQDRPNDHTDLLVLAHEAARLKGRFEAGCIRFSQKSRSLELLNTLGSYPS